MATLSLSQFCALYPRLSVAELAKMGRDGVVTPAWVNRAFRARLAQVEPQLEAVCDTYQIEGTPMGRLAGVPFLVKDLAFPVAGKICRNGSRFPALPAQRNAILLDRLLAEGAQCLGLSHSCELGGTSTSESLAWGKATANPYDLSRSAGGSSGGAAAAVAAGLVPMAQASDAGGSITIPAALCGLVGLKPRHGAVPLGPERIEGVGGLAAQMLLTRSIEDTVLAFEVASGQSLKLPREKLTLGFVAEAVDGFALDAARLARLEQLARRLEALGHQIVPFRLPPLTPSLAKSERALRLASVAASVAALEASTGTAARAEHFEAVTWERLLAGRAISGVEVLQAREEILAYRAKIEAVFDKVDLVFSAALGAQAPAHGVLTLAREAEALNRPLTAFTRPWNLSGLPSLTLPLLRNDRGLPEGVLFAGLSEARLLGFAGQVEARFPWRHDHLTTDFILKERAIA